MRLLHILFACWSIVAPAGCVPTGSLLVNGDFEDREQTALIPGWQHRRLDNGSSGIVARAGTNGSKALKIASPFIQYGSGLAYQTLGRPPGQFQRYQLSARVRTVGVSGEGARLYIYGSAGGEQVNTSWSAALTGDQDWTSVELTYLAEESVDSLTVGLILAGEGAAWFDDVVLVEAAPPAGPISERATAYIDEFFNKVSPQALDHEQLDWPKLRQQALVYAAGAQTEADVHSALMLLLRKINKHSFLATPQVQQQSTTEGGAPPAIRYADGRRINHRIAYLNVPNISGPTAVTVPFADSLQALIRALDTEQTEGWVVDLRENPGGNCWPMLTGLGPLFTGDTLGFFQQRDGSEAESWRYAAGQSFIDQSVQLSLTQSAYVLHNPHPRVAVLTGPQTASSGEVVTVAFREQPGARSFGQPTGGYSTTNTDIPLSDGATVYLTVSVYADRTGRTYGEAIVPDEVIAGGEALATATAWLMQDQQCDERLTAYGTPFGELGTTDLRFLAGSLDGVDLIGFGEDSHGTAEFTRLAGDLFLYLARERGFRSFIIEDAVGSVRKMDRFIQGEIADVRDVLWDGNWRYYTTEFVDLLTRLREYNRLHADDPVHLYGPEMQYVASDADFLQAYLAAQGAALDLQPLTEFATIWNELTPEQLATYTTLTARADSLLTDQSDTWRRADAAAYDYARHHLAVIEQYLAAYQRPEEPKHELREAGMFENIRWILERSPNGKALYWAHNGHVHDGLVNGSYAATGKRLRERYGNRYYAIGTDFGTGSFLAHSADAQQTGWGLARREAPPIDPTTLTACFDRWGHPNYFVDFRAARQDTTLRSYTQQTYQTMAGAGAQVRDYSVEQEPYLLQFDGMIYLKKSSPINLLE